MIPMLMIFVPRGWMANLFYPLWTVSINDFSSYSVTHNTYNNNKFLFKFLFTFCLKSGLREIKESLSTILIESPGPPSLLLTSRFPSVPQSVLAQGVIPFCSKDLAFSFPELQEIPTGPFLHLVEA